MKSKFENFLGLVIFSSLTIIFGISSTVKKDAKNYKENSELYSKGNSSKGGKNITQPSCACTVRTPHNSKQA